MVTIEFSAIMIFAIFVQCLTFILINITKKKKILPYHNVKLIVSFILETHIPRVVIAVFMTGGGGGSDRTELHIANPKKYLASKFSTKKNMRDLITSILIYSIKQTLSPKKIGDRSLDPKKLQRV